MLNEAACGPVPHLGFHSRVRSGVCIFQRVLQPLRAGLVGEMYNLPRVTNVFRPKEEMHHKPKKSLCVR